MSAKFETLLSKEKIAQRVDELGKQIRKDYAGETIEVLCVLNGSFIFCADLIRAIGGPLEVNFIKASSYGDGTESSGNVKVWGLDGLNLTNKKVLLVEDIVDTGHTIAALMPIIEKSGAESVQLASLLFKPDRNKIKVDINYLGFEIEDHFVLGYGLDLAGKYRELSDIVIYNPDA